MNVFQTHADIVSDYATYIRSFLKIDDPAIRHTVEEALNQGKLWPEPLLQFNPSFEMYGSLEKLAQAGDIHADIRDIFKGYSLYKHQVEAIRLGTSGRDFIVTSGTGSGKSLTYIGSIFHYLLSNPQAKGVTAVVVYPMNALINSQFEEFTRYKDNYEKTTGKTFPISFGQYTGQEKEDKRAEMRENPPQILLTNYMMLELLLTRLRERSIRDGIYENLSFLVFDELHNRYIYALADYAVVVDSAEREGGTWAGAIEDLRHEWTPLYVRDPGDKPGNRALIAKGARSFTYQFATRESLKEYLAPNESVVSTAALELAPSAIPAGTTEPLPKEIVGDAKPLDDNAHVVDQGAPLAITNESVSTESLDLFPLFLERLPSVLGAGSKTEEEIRVALGLEKSQVKAWLAAAVSTGCVEKLKKPVAYALPKQKSLC